MYLVNEFNKKEIELIKKAGIMIENKEYTIEDRKRIERDITEYIMNHSSKDGSIGRLQNEYQSVFRTLEIK